MNYLENKERGAKQDFGFLSQSRCTTLIRILIKIQVCGAKPKLGNFDPGKPFVDKLVELSRKLRMWRRKRLWFLIAVILFYINKNMS